MGTAIRKTLDAKLLKQELMSAVVGMLAAKSDMRAKFIQSPSVFLKSKGIDPKTVNIEVLVKAVLDLNKKLSKTMIGRIGKAFPQFPAAFVNPKPIVPKPILPKPILPKPILPKPILPKPILPKPILPKPIVPKPIVPKPIVPQIKPIVPKIKPIVPQIKPIVPQIKPIVPKIKPIVPKIKPIVPKIKPIVPQIKPIVPQIKPIVPQIKPIVPQIKPYMPCLDVKIDIERIKVLEDLKPLISKDVLSRIVNIRR